MNGDENFWARQRLLFIFVSLVLVITFAPLLYNNLSRSLRPDRNKRKVLDTIDLRSVRINSAGAGELDGLPGIGPVLARRIIEERSSGGLYGGIKDLERVDGIGPAKAKALEPYLLFQVRDQAFNRH